MLCHPPLGYQSSLRNLGVRCLTALSDIQSAAVPIRLSTRPDFSTNEPRGANRIADLIPYSAKPRDPLSIESLASRKL